MNSDPILQAWFDKALDMTSSKKRKKAMMRLQFDQIPMISRLKLSEDNKTIFILILRVEAAVKEILSGAKISAMAKKYRLDEDSLHKEIRKFRGSKVEEYQYNMNEKLGKIFTFKEELLLIAILATVPKSRCMCQACTVERLPSLIYHAARLRGKSYPLKWDKHQQASKGWMTDFVLEHHYEISESFPAECQITPGTCTKAECPKFLKMKLPVGVRKRIINNHCQKKV